MAKNFPSLMKNINLHIQEAKKKNPSRINVEIGTQTHHSKNAEEQRQRKISAMTTEA